MIIVSSLFIPTLIYCFIFVQFRARKFTNVTIFIMFKINHEYFFKSQTVKRFRVFKNCGGYLYTDINVGRYRIPNLGISRETL